MTILTSKINHGSALYNDLKKALADLLATGPQDTANLARATGYSSTCVRRRLVDMEKTGQIYHQRVTHMRGFSHMWHLGDGAGIPTDVDGDFLSTKQIVTRRYPAINRRDPLVAALHGMGPAPSLMLEAEG